MQCPVDGHDLVMTERSGVEIDYCPKCRGVWLDRGELDKILERGSSAKPAVAERPVELREPGADRSGPAFSRGDAAPRRSRDDDDDDDRRGGRRGRREGFFSDLFDF